MTTTANNTHAAAAVVVVDGTIEKAVEEIDEVLEEMRELAMLQEQQYDETTLISEEAYSSDDDEQDGGHHLALELNEADESFRKRRRDDANVSMEVEEEEELEDKTSFESVVDGNIAAEEVVTPEPPRATQRLVVVEDVEDRPIAITIGENGSNHTQTRRNSRAADHPVATNGSLPSKTKPAKPLRDKVRTRKLRLAGICIASIGLVILIVALLVILRRKDTLSSSSSAQQSYDSSLFVPDPEYHAAEIKPTTAPTTKPTARPTPYPTASATSSAPYRVSRFPSASPAIVVDSSSSSGSTTDLPTVDATTNTWEPYGDEEEEENVDDEDDDYYYNDKSKKGKGHDHDAIAYREWE
jgi:hypothetical protein